VNYDLCASGRTGVFGSDGVIGGDFLYINGVCEHPLRPRTWVAARGNSPFSRLNAGRTPSEPSRELGEAGGLRVRTETPLTDQSKDMVDGQGKDMVDTSEKPPCRAVGDRGHEA
jgi:hypothetical protein